MLTLPQLTLKGSGCPRPTPPQPPQPWGSRRLPQGLNRGACCASTSRKQQSPRLPPRSVVGVCSRFPHNRLGAIPGFISEVARRYPGVPGFVSQGARVCLAGVPALSRGPWVCLAVPGFPSGRYSQPPWQPLGADPRAASAGQFLARSEGPALPGPEMLCPPPLTSPGMEDFNRNNILKPRF